VVSPTRAVTPPPYRPPKRATELWGPPLRAQTVRSR